MVLSHYVAPTHGYLLILKVEVFGNVHALQPADIASTVSSLAEGLLQGLYLLLGHDM